MAKATPQKNSKKSNGGISGFVQDAGTTVSKTAQQLGKMGLNTIEKIQNSMTLSGTEYTSLKSLLEHELKDLYSAENQLTAALPKMAKKASTPALKAAFSSHLKETEQHIKRLQKIGALMGISLSGKTCEAMKGLVKEGGEVLKATGNAALIDAALIASAQRVEHYEMAGYGCVRAMAEKLSLKEVASLLQQTLNEEGAADKKLTAIAERDVLGSSKISGGKKAGSQTVNYKKPVSRSRKSA